MGYLSVLLVRHDVLPEIQKDTALGSKVYNTVVGFDRHGRSHHVSTGVEVVAGNIHASDLGTVVVEGNTAYHVEKAMSSSGGSLPGWSKAEVHLVNLVRLLGYKVVRPRNKKK